MDKHWVVAGGDAHKHTITMDMLDLTGVELDVARSRENGVHGRRAG